jgi:phosphoglycerate dehydrogenase-like enzyme
MARNPVQKRRIMAFALSAATGLCAAAATPTPEPALEVAETIAQLRVEEAPRPERENPRWQPPRKILLLAQSNAPLAAQAQAFAKQAPAAQVVVARDLAMAAAEAVDADVIIGSNPEVCDARILGNARHLRWLASLSAGIETCVNQPAVQSPGLLMTNMRGVDAPAIAEHAIAMVLALAHGLDVFAINTSKATWGQQYGGTTPMQRVDGKTLLVVGLGSIGTEVAWRGKALGMTVVATRDGGSGKPDFVSYVGKPAELLTLAPTADVIVSCVPLTPQTTGLYDAAFFAALKPSALFVNIARGGSVVTAELVRALNEHRLAGAGLDVVDPEPLPPDHPLWRAPRVLISPHTSSRSDLPGEARWILARENLRRYVAGEKMLLVVDPRRGY